MAELLFLGDDHKLRDNYFDLPKSSRLPCRAWRPSDRAMFENTKGMAKSLNKFDDRFRFIMALTKATSMSPVIKAIKPEDGKVTVVLTNNVTTKDGYIPQTSWILAHRMYHCFQAVVAQNGSNDIDQYFKDYTAIIVSLWNDAYPFAKMKMTYDVVLFTKVSFEDQYWDKYYDANKLMFIFLRLMSTFRSARLDIITNDLEVPCELFAQYMITGGVKFAPISDDHDDVFMDEVIRKQAIKFAQISPVLQSTKRQNDLINQNRVLAAQKLNILFGKMVEWSHGRVIAF